MAPIVVTVLLVALMAAMMGVMLWGYCIDPGDAPPLAITLVRAAMPLLVIAGMLYALVQRIREIGKGEIDDAKKY